MDLQKLAMRVQQNRLEKQAGNVSMKGGGNIENLVKSKPLPDYNPNSLHNRTKVTPDELKAYTNKINQRATSARISDDVLNQLGGRVDQTPSYADFMSKLENMNSIKNKKMVGGGLAALAGLGGIGGLIAADDDGKVSAGEAVGGAAGAGLATAGLAYLLDQKYNKGKIGDEVQSAGTKAYSKLKSLLSGLKV